MNIYKIGDITLDERIGVGAMGEVYRAVDRNQVPVAVKIIKPTNTVEAEREVDREVLSQARLVHPHLAILRDIGSIGSTDDAPPGFEVGCSFLVMDLAEATLTDLIPLQTWAETRRVALQMLDGLAYAHARSVIHRDLKPSNVLMRRIGSDWSAQIADFGISVILDRKPGVHTAAELRHAAGTPAYMAPEQIHGEWQDYGPWTDLYALGCIVWELVCGRPPYLGANVLETLRLHIDANLPRYRPTMEVPDGLQDWLVRALQPNVVGRFRRAADAARALVALGDAVDGGPTRKMEPLEHDTLVWTKTLAPLVNQNQTAITTLPLANETAEDPCGDRAVDQSALFEKKPAVPADWSTGLAKAPTARAPSLIGIRPPQIVGRMNERNSMWASLRRAQQSASVEVVFLKGPEDSGRTQLANWLACRARELAVSGRMWAEFGDGSEGFGGMLRQAYFLWGVEEESYKTTMLHMVPRLEEDPFFEADIDTLARIAQGHGGPHHERFAAMRRLIERIGRMALPSLYLEDIEDNLEALSFIDFMSTKASPPCLIVATVDSRASSDPLFDRLFRSLLEHDNVHVIDVQPLPESHHRALLDQMLQLTPATADHIVELTLGSPSLAIELLVDWLDRGVLAENDRGFRLSMDPGDLPDDVVEVCYGRLERVVAGLPGNHEQSWRALEFAAAWGQRIDFGVWKKAMPAVEVHEIAYQAHRHGIAQQTPTGFEFANGLFRKALALRAQRSGRLTELHLVSVEVIGDTEDPGALWRKAEHLVAAGLRQRALGPLLAGARQAFRTGGVDAKLQFLNKHDQLVEQLGLPADDPSRLAGHVERTHCLILLDSDDVRVDELTAIDFSAIPRVGSIAFRLASLWSAKRGDTAESLARGAQAVEYARTLGDDEECGAALVTHADRLRQAGKHAAAQRHIDEFDLLEKTSVFLAVARDITAGSIHLAEGDVQAARDRFERAASMSAELRHAGLQQSCFNRLGDLERFSGNSSRARDYYLAQRDLVKRVGQHVELPTIEFNLALAAILEGDVEQARIVTRRAPEPDRLARLRRLLELYVNVFEGDFAGARSNLERAAQLSTQPFDKDEKWLLGHARDVATDKKQSELAALCLELRDSPDPTHLCVT